MNKRMQLSGFSDYCIDVKNHRIYNKHGNLIKPMLDSSGRSCVRMINDSGKRKTMILATITNKLGGIRSEREENTITLLKSYYHLINPESDSKSGGYWATAMMNVNPHIDRFDILDFLNAIRPNKRMHF